MPRGKGKQPRKGSKTKILVDLITNKGWRPTYKEVAEYFYQDYNMVSRNRANGIIQFARKWMRRKGLELYCDKDTHQLKILDSAKDLLYQVKLNEKKTIATIKNVYRQQDNLERDFADEYYAIREAQASALRILNEISSAGLL